MVITISSSRIVGQDTLDDLKSFYQFRHENALIQFLANHPHLLSILTLGKTFIRQYLPTSYVFLECVLDPELADYQLVVYFTRTIDDTEEAITQIENLYDDWLGGYNSDIRSQIYVRYDYL